MLSTCRSVLVVAVVALATLGVAAGSALADTNVQERIVVLNDGTTPDKVAKDLGLTPKFVYRYALRGFAADMGDQRASQLEADRRVLFVAEDQLRPAAVPVGPGQRTATDLRDIPQVIPFGIERVGGLASRTARIDGRQDPLDVDIAVIDTGVESVNSDLRVVSGYDCIPGGNASTEDPNGHGTHVAGIAAARDNAYGVVGVAPDARIWPIRAIASDGFGFDSWVLCGIDWATKNAGQIDVVN